jgi:hypothetical protein
VIFSCGDVFSLKPGPTPVRKSSIGRNGDAVHHIRPFLPPSFQKRKPGQFRAAGAANYASSLARGLVSLMICRGIKNHTYTMHVFQMIYIKISRTNQIVRPLAKNLM